MKRRNLHRLARARRILALSPVLAIAATAEARSQPHEPRPPAIVAASLGLTPEVLVAAGCQQAEANGVLDAADSHPDLRQQLESARNAVETLETQAQALAQTLADNPADSDARDALQSVATELSQKRAELQQIRGSFAEAMCASLTPPARERIETCLAQQKEGIPVQFRVVPWENAETAELRRALTAERRANRTGSGLAPGHQQILSEARNRPQVSAAIDRLNAYLPGVRAAFAQHR